MKKNKNGFMLAEVFIISSFVLGILVYMFVQINSIMRSYNKSFSYNTVSGLYITNEIKKYVSGDTGLDISTACTNNIYVADNIDDNLKEDANIKNIIIGNLNYIKNNATDNDKITPKALDFIKYLESKDKCVIIVEFSDDTYASLNM